MATETFTTPGAGTWTPGFAGTALIECWGAGGSSTTTANANRAGGGSAGGGAESAAIGSNAAASRARGCFDSTGFISG